MKRKLVTVVTLVIIGWLSIHGSLRGQELQSRADWQTRLRNPDVAVRLVAIASLGEYLTELPVMQERNCDLLLPLLVSALDDQDATLSSAAAEQLKVLGKKYGHTVVTALTPALQHPSSMARYLAAEVLGETRSPGAFTVLQSLLRDADTYVQGAAASAMGTRKDPAALAILMPLFHHPSTVRYVKVCILDAFRKIGDKRAVPVLFAALRDKEDFVRYNAAKALGEFPSRQVAAELLWFPYREGLSETHDMAVSSLKQIRETTRDDTLRWLLREYKNGNEIPLQQLYQPIPNLSLNLESSRFGHNRRVSIKATISNQGNSHATGLQMICPLHFAMDYLCSSPSAAWLPQRKMLRWKLPEIAAGANVSLVLELKNSRAPWGSVTIPFLLVAGEYKTIECASFGFCWCCSAPHISTYDTEDPVEVGRTTVYVVEIRNEATNDMLLARLEDIIPEQMEFIKAEGPTSYRVEGHRILFDPVPSWPSGERKAYKIMCKAIKPGRAINEARIRYPALGTSIHYIPDREETTVVSKR